MRVVCLAFWRRHRTTALLALWDAARDASPVELEAVAQVPRGRPAKTPERVAEARRLRDQGAKYREIAGRFGISVQAAFAWVNDPDGVEMAARKATYAGTCTGCGGPTNGCNGPGSASDVCMNCIRAAAADLHREIAELWDQGLTTAAIAETVGLTEARVCAVGRDLRARGRGCPPRRAGGSRDVQAYRAQVLLSLYEAGMPYEDIARHLGYKNGRSVAAAVNHHSANSWQQIWEQREQELAVAA